MTFCYPRRLGLSQGTRVRHSLMAHCEDACGDLFGAGWVLAQTEGMQLLMDEISLGLARFVAVHERELAPADVHDTAARGGHGEGVRVLAMTQPCAVGEDDQTEIAGRCLP